MMNINIFQIENGIQSPLGVHLKITNNESQTFYSRKFISMKELNEHWGSNKEIIKCIINHMYEELKIYLDNEFDLDKKYYSDDLTIENRIRFIPNTIFRNELNKITKKEQ